MASVTFTPETGGDGSTVTDDNDAGTGLGNGGHRTRFVPMFQQTVNTSARAVTKAAEAAASEAIAADYITQALATDNTLPVAIAKEINVNTQVSVEVYNAGMDKDGGFAVRCAGLPNEMLISYEAGQVLIYDNTTSGKELIKTITRANISCGKARNGLLYVGTSDAGVFVYNMLNNWEMVRNYTTELTSLVINDIDVNTDGVVGVATSLGINIIVYINILSIEYTANLNTISVDLTDDTFAFAPNGNLAFFSPIPKVSVNSSSAGAIADAIGGVAYNTSATLDGPLLGLPSKVLTGAMACIEGMGYHRHNLTTPSEGMVNYTTADYISGYMPGDIKGAWLADTVAETLTAPAELITNGTFTTDIAGWTVGTSVVGSRETVTFVNGGLKVLNSGDSSGSVYQVISGLAVGASYSFTVDSNNETGGAYIEIRDGTVIGSPQTHFTSGGGKMEILFTALGTSQYFACRCVAADGLFSTFDNVSVKPAEVDDRSYNNKGLTVNGSITKAAVATGADLMAYSGFSAANYLNQAYNADLDFGTGDFYVMGWVNISNHVASQYIVNRDSAVTGSRFIIFIHSDGGLRFSVDDDTTDRQAASSTISTGEWLYFTGVYTTDGAVAIYVDGSKSGEVTGSPLNTISNTSATLGIGAKASDGSLPLNAGSISLVRMGKGAPSDKQVKEIYEAEKGLFEPNTQCTLDGNSSDVKDLVMNEVTGKLEVLSATHRSQFDGLLRTDSEALVATKIDASGDTLVYS